MTALKQVVQEIQLNFDGEPWWWKNPRQLGLILEALKNNGLWLDFQYVGKMAAPLDRFESVEQVLAVSTGWLNHIYAIHSHGEGGLTRAFQGSYLLLTLDPGQLRLQLAVDPPALERLRDTLVDRMVGFLFQLRATLGESVHVGPQAFVQQYGVLYPRCRPGRLPEPFPFGHLLDAFDAAYFAKNPRFQKEAEKLLTAPTPRGCERVERNGLVLFRWARDLTDEVEVARSCARGERFLLENLNPPVIAAYNELGDLRVIARDLEARPPLTMYDAAKKIGYKALHATETGAVQPSDWAAAAKWAKARQLPDGTPIEVLRLIVPFRSAALALRERAVAEGIECVLYADEQAIWRDPSPPGLWQD